MKNTLFLFAIFSVLMVAQETPPSDPPQERGWRKLNGGPEDQAAVPPERQYTPRTSRSVGVPAALVLPAGTWITIRVDTPLSSNYSAPGQPFTGTLSQPLVVNGFVVARRGQTIGGVVSDVRKAGRVQGTSMLAFELTEISLVDGQQLPVRTQLMEFAGGTSRGTDAVAIGATTGTGAAIGAMAGGGMGAGIGAAAGAAASVIGVLATRGRPAEVYPETPVTFRILEPVTIETDQAPHAFLPSRQSDYSAQLQPRTVVRNPAPVYGGGGGVWAPLPPYWYGPGWWGPGWYGPSVGVYVGVGPRYYGRGWGGGWGYGGYRRW